MARPEPLSGLAAIWTVARSSSAGGLRKGRLMGLLALVGLPVLIALVVLAFGEGRGGAFIGFAATVNAGYLSVIIPLVMIFLGTAAFGDEWEGGTGPYLMGLPIRRGAMVIGRWLVALGRGLVLVVPAVTIFYVVSLARHEGAIVHYAGELVAVLAGLAAVVLGYLAVFVFFGVALKRCVMASLLYLLVFEFLLGHLPLRIANLSIAFHGRSILYQLTDEDNFVIAFADDVVRDLPSPATSLMVILAFVAVFLAAAAWTLDRKQITGEAQTEE